MPRCALQVKLQGRTACKFPQMAPREALKAGFNMLLQQLQEEEPTRLLEQYLMVLR